MIIEKTSSNNHNINKKKYEFGSVRNFDHNMLKCVDTGVQKNNQNNVLVEQLATMVSWSCCIT